MADTDGIIAGISAALGAAGGVAGAYVKALIGGHKEARSIEAMVRGFLADEVLARERLTRRVQALEDESLIQQETRGGGRASLHEIEELREIYRGLDDLEKELNVRIDRIAGDHRDLEARFNEFLQGEIDQWKDLQKELRNISIAIETLKLQTPRRR